MTDVELSSQLNYEGLIFSSCAGTQVCWSCIPQTPQTNYNGGSGQSSDSHSLTDSKDAGPPPATGPSSNSHSSTESKDAGPQPGTKSPTGTAATGSDPPHASRTPSQQVPSVPRETMLSYPLTAVVSSCLHFTSRCM